MATINGFVFAFILVWILKLIIAFFLSSLLVLFAALGIHKIHIQKTERKDWDLLASYKAELSSVAESGDKISNPQNLADAVNLAHALSIMSVGESVSAKAAMRQVVLKSKLPEILRQALKSRSWGTRFKALTGFCDFASPTEFRHLIEFEYGEKNTRVFGNGLMACAACISSTRDFGELLALMQLSMEISASYYEGIFRTALRALEETVGRATTIKHIKRLLLESDINPVLKASLIHANSKEQFPELETAALDLARDVDEPVITVAILRALRKSGNYDRIIEENIGNSRQYLNIVALHASGVCKDPGPDLIRKIEEQLRSRNYLARTAAATSLKQLGEKGEQVLVRAGHGDDRYASDISTYVLSLG